MQFHMNENGSDAAKKCKVVFEKEALSSLNDLYIFNMPVVHLKMLISLALKKPSIYNINMHTKQALGGFAVGRGL